DPDLVHAIVSVESGYDVRAVSPKGALGLMQLVPATARRFGVDDPFDPKQNVEGGTSYIQYLLDLFGGGLALALAAYNAGEQSVLRANGIPPFPETQAYVRKVKSFYQSVSHTDAGEGQAPQANFAAGSWNLKSPSKANEVSVRADGASRAGLYT